MNKDILRTFRLFTNCGQCHFREIYVHTCKQLSTYRAKAREPSLYQLFKLNTSAHGKQKCQMKYPNISP